MPSKLPLIARAITLGCFALGSMRASDPVVYVTTFAQDYITALDPSSDQLTRVANSGINGTSFVVSPDGKTAYVVASTAYPSPTLAINTVDLATGKAVGPITGTSPNIATNVALSSDGSLLYFVGLAGLTTVDTSTGAVVRTSASSIECPCDVVLSQDGASAYVSSSLGLYIFAAQTGAQTAFLSSSYIRGLAISPDGTKLYFVTPNQPDVVSVLDTSSNTIVAGIPASGVGLVSGAAISPDGSTLYVPGPDGLLRISTDTNTVTDLVAAPALSSQVTPSRDGQYVYVNRVIALQQENFVGNTAPGLLRFNTSSATFSNMSIGGPAIAEQIPSSGSPVYILEAPYTLSTEDPVTSSLTQTIGSFNGTYALTESSAGNLVAGVSEVTLSGVATAYVSLLDTSTHKLTGQFTFAPPAKTTLYPFSLAANGDGTLAYLGTWNSSTSQPAISVLQLPAGTLQQSVPIATTNPQEPVFLAVSPDSSTIYALLADNVCAVSLSTYATIGCASYVLQLTGGPYKAYATTLAVSSDGTHVYVPASEAKVLFDSEPGLFLVSINTSTMKVDHAVQFKDVTGSSAIAYSAAANSVYLPGAKKIYRVDLGPFTLAVTQPLNYTPISLAATPDGTELLVTGSLNGTQIFDGTTLAPISSIAGGLQQAIVIAPQ